MRLSEVVPDQSIFDHARGLYDPTPLLASAPSDYWGNLAADYLTAYERLYADQPHSPEALAIPMCVGEHETNNGRAWPGTYDIGATQLAEHQVPADLWAKGLAGQLPAGSVFSSLNGEPGGVLHVDTHPTPNGPKPYYAWFALFNSRIEGIEYFYGVFNRLSNHAADQENATPESVCTGMYLGCYFEGAHAGARPCGRRVVPLTPPEISNISDYSRAVELLMPAALAGVAEVGSFGTDQNVTTNDTVS